MTISMQEYFDKTVEHLRGMDRRSFIAGRDVCAYLDRQGRKCAVGCHIPDGHPAQNFNSNANGTGVDELAERYPDLEGIAFPAGRSGILLAGQLQKTHDDPDNWIPTVGFDGEGQLHKVADIFNLKYTRQRRREPEASCD